MAIANIKDLWELASTILGGTAAAQIVDSNTDMSAPTTPLELTFTQFYDQVRTMVFEEADWLFARKYADLTLAPTKDWNGVEQVWDPGGRWDYVYQRPADCARFIGFVHDYPDAAPVELFQVRRLPLKYESITSNGGSPPSYTFAAPFSNYIYEGSVWVEFEDESYDVWVARDVRADTGTYENDFFYQIDDTRTLPAFVFDYNATVAGTFRIDFPGVDWGTSAYPSTVTLNAAVKVTDEDDWTEHIFCNEQNAVGEYVAETTDPSVWPKRFQTLVAAELALAASGVHAKSSKQIQLIERQVLRAREQAYEYLAMDQGKQNINVGLSSAHQARL